MTTTLVYLKLELKRAWKKLPHIYGGAIVLVLLLGTIALLSSRALYGDSIAGRIEIGVVLPEEDLVAEKVLSMVSSLDSVKSLCDFTYMNREEALERMKKRELFAVMELPEGFVQDIMNGTNTPVRILLPNSGNTESRIFRALTDAGARTLAASQAGIYAGDELCGLYELESAIPQLEGDLNRIYLGYSLSRLDFFRHRQVNAVEDVDLIAFYGCSAVTLFLLLCGIPACTYLAPVKNAMRQKLRLLGVGNMTRILGRILGMGSLLTAVSAPIFVVAWAKKWMVRDVRTVFVAILLCISVASVLVLFFQLAGSMTGGMMGLFLIGIAQHFIAGGFLPSIFLSETIRAVGAWMPSSVWMEAMKTMITGAWDFKNAVLVVGILLLCTGLGAGGEVRS